MSSETYISYEEHLAFLTRQALGAQAELHGFLAASQKHPVARYSKNDYEQQRYEQGLRDGQAKLIQERRI